MKIYHIIPSVLVVLTVLLLSGCAVGVRTYDDGTYYHYRAPTYYYYDDYPRYYYPGYYYPYQRYYYQRYYYY